MTVNWKRIKIQIIIICLDSWHAFEFAVIQEMAMFIV